MKTEQGYQPTETPTNPPKGRPVYALKEKMSTETLKTVKNIIDRVKEACDSHYFPGCGGCPFNDSPDCLLGWPKLEWENQPWYKELKETVCSR